jgi:transcriptional regulator with XRE-family HTH domain
MSAIPPEIDNEVRRYADILRAAIRAAGLSVSEVERRLGAGPKALRRIFSGHVDLKLKHILAILHLIGMEEADFFALAARKRTAARSRPTAADYLSAFKRMGVPGEFGAHDEIDPRSPEEFDRLVEEAVNRVLERRSREDKKD